MQFNPTYASLFEPHTFLAGHMTVQNRLVLASTAIDISFTGGALSPEEIELLRRAHGAGMVITSPCHVAPHGRVRAGEWSSASDDAIPALRHAAEAVKSAGALAILLLHHGGRLAPASLLGHAPLAPSALAADTPGADMPREMTEGEIEETIKAFGAGARRAILAGFDGVEIHGAGGYLLQQFFSPHANRRADQWGGSIENRAAFPIAILEEVQEVVRRNAYRPFSIGYRLSPEEREEGGIDMSDSLELVEGLAACRPDWVHVATPNYFAGSVRDGLDHRARAQVIAERVRGRVTVIGGGSVRTASDALEVLAEGSQLVAIDRSLAAEPARPVETAEEIIA